VKEGNRHYQVTIGLEELNDMLKGRLPSGSKLVAVDRELFDRGMRLLLYHPDFPEGEEGKAVRHGLATFQRDDDGTVRMIEVNGW